jgi:hypothetical protein
VIQDLKELLGQVSTPADTATVLLAGSLGFLVDAGLNAVGFLSPGVVGVVSASTALGLKKSWEAAWMVRKRQYDAYRAANKAIRRADILLQFLHIEVHSPLADRLARGLEQELRLHRMGIVEDEALDVAVEYAVEELRAELTRQQTISRPAAQREQQEQGGPA